jgi:hypothetical protein
MYSRVVLLKDSGISQGFNTIADAMAAADANDLINVYPGAHSVASVLTAKSNVTIFTLPGASITFANHISLGTGITNFKIVGEGNISFTLNAFYSAGVHGSGNGIDIRGNLTIGGVAQYADSIEPIVQTEVVTLSAKNITIIGVDIEEANNVIIFDAVGGNDLHTVIAASEILTIPKIATYPCYGGSYVTTLKADVINCVSENENNFGPNVFIKARVLNIGSNNIFLDPDVIGVSYFTLEVDEINLNAATGIDWNGSACILIFVKMSRIKNLSVANPAHVFNGVNDPSGIVFKSGAILYTAGGADSKAMLGVTNYVSNRNIYSNKPLAEGAAVVGAAFVQDSNIIL